MKASRALYAILMVGMILFVFALVGLGAYIMTQGRGIAGLPFGGEEGGLKVYAQAPPLSEIGQEIKLILTIENASSDYRQVDEIRFPDRLMEVAVVQSIFPSLSPGNMSQEFYGDKTGFKIGIMLAPGETRAFEVKLLPWQIADVTGELEVVSGDSSSNTGFRLVFDKPVALAPTEILTPTPPEATATATQVPESATPTPVVLPYSSVVKITAKQKYGVWLRPQWGGSGTIVTPDGLILTNAHLIDPDPTDREKTFWVISLTEDPAREPVETYFAEPVFTDVDADLAILKITTDLKYNEIDWTLVSLPAALLGDSNSLQLGDPLTILGYPGIGGDTITLTSGNVGGFTAQKDYGERAFIKTAASISGGTSGGTALDRNGLVVGIPTQLGYGGQDELVDCRVIADTNGDGEVDARDQCIPVGGFINALRPVNLAIPMIELAKQIAGRGGYPTPTSTSTPPFP